MNKDGQLWHELLGAWLKTMGCEVNDNIYQSHCDFYYKGIQYQYWIGFDAIDIGDQRGYGQWADINLDTTEIDVCNPSFDPDEFFAPFKDWLEEQ